MKQVENKYKCLPFWSWNGELDEISLKKQIKWMHKSGVGGFFMHARAGLKTEYLGEKWFNCIKECSVKADENGMYPFAYDENGWPSGFVGGKLLEDIENHDKYITYKICDYDKNSTVSYDISTEKLVRAKSGKNLLNLYVHYSTSTVDILNPKVVDKFISLTHEEYKKRDKYSLKGFFTDEPQYYRWNTPYTNLLEKYFEEKYGENIWDRLGLLFVEKEGYRDFRYKFWKAMQSLMLENFSAKLYKWCDDNNYKLTGHYVEESTLGYQIMCCGGVMPFYEFEHIPGIDKLERRLDDGLSSKQLGSVASQLNKKQSLCEMFACCGWDVTPKELKTLAESMYVNGVNLMCQHLLPYTEHGQRKRDYPAHFSAVNPWVKNGFKTFNDYFSLLGKILSESKEVVNVGVLNPITSCYFDYKREVEPGFNVKKIEEPYMALLRELTELQIPHHIIDEVILARYGKVDKCVLTVGNCKYDYLIIPRIYTMDKSTERLLKEYIKNGGKVLLTDEKPSYLEGQEYDYGYLESNTTLDEIKKSQTIKSERHKTVRVTQRVSDDGRSFVYLVNTGTETDYELKIDGVKSFESYDIFNDEYRVINGKIHFDEGQSYILYYSDKEPCEKAELEDLYLDKEFEICEKPDNYLTLDYLHYSFDGVEYSEKLHHMGVLDELLKKRYNGDLYLKYCFKVKKIPKHCNALIENSNIKEVSVNGNIIKKTGVSDVEKELYYYDCAKYLQIGDNEVVVRINYYQSEKVYYALFGENVTESIINCLTYDTDIEAIYLKGDFGVYGDFSQGNSENVLLGENFYIDEQKRTVTELIRQGFPFFAGTIKLKQKVKVNSVNKRLVINKRFHLIDVKINGKLVNRLMFNGKLDLHDYLTIGENKIELELCVGNRNLLGPFHTEEQENNSVGPYTFERKGTWVNGKSSIVRDSYSFVKTIL